MNYDGQMIRAEIEPDRAKFEAQLREGQPPNYTPDQRTRDIWCITKWLNQKLEGDKRRIELLWYFNRTVRAEEDPFVVTARVINKHLSNEPIEEVYTRFSRDRKG